MTKKELITKAKELYNNGEEIDQTLLEIGFTFSKDDKVGYIPSIREILHY